MTTTITNGTMAAVDLLLQEAIVVGLHTLVEDDRAMDELLAREDLLQFGTADAWRDALKAALIDALDPESDGYVQVLIGWPVPWGAARLPAISLVVQGGGTTSDCVGDEIRTATDHVLVGADQELFETIEEGRAATTTIQVTTWTPAPELTTVLDAAVAWAIQRQQPALLDKGVMEIDIRDAAAMEVSMELEPRVSYVPARAVTLDWTRGQSYRRKVPNRVRLLAPTPIT